MTKHQQTRGDQIMHWTIYGLSPARALFWSILAAMLFVGVVALGAVFQSRQSETWLSMPSLWFFGLIMLPVLLYGLVHFHWAKHDKVR